MRAFLSFGVVAGVLFARAGYAVPRRDECSGDRRDWVMFAASKGQPAPFNSTIRAHLAAELEAEGILLCPERRAGDQPFSHPPLAVVRLGLSPSSREGRGRDGAEAPAVGITVEDAITRKSLYREIELAGTAEDARPLTIALSASELLKASWAELNLRDAQPPTVPVPKSIEREVGSQLGRSELRPSLSVRVAGEEFSGGLRQLGPELGIAFLPWARLTLLARMGVRSALRTAAPDGEVAPDGWVVGAGAALRVSPQSWSPRLDFFGRLDVFHVRFVPLPKGRATGIPAKGESVVLSLGMAGKLRLSQSAWFEGSISAGPTLHGVEATDAGVGVVRAGGLAVSGSVGIAISF